MERPDLRPDDSPVRVVNQVQLGRALAGTYDEHGPLAALCVSNTNPAVVCPDSGSVLAGLAREDLFTVVAEQFMTDTARYADVVLPATTQLEHLDVVKSWGHRYLTLNQPAVAPLGPVAAQHRDLPDDRRRAIGSRPSRAARTPTRAPGHLPGGLRRRPTRPSSYERGWTKIDPPPDARAEGHAALRSDGPPGPRSAAGRPGRTR